MMNTVENYLLVLGSTLLISGEMIRHEKPGYTQIIIHHTAN